ncbi:MAG TPA: GxxExxY protein [Chthoniobacteraceae bacterium]
MRRDFAPIHGAQLITYLKLADKRLGFLINFNVRLLKHGLKRIVNRLPPGVHLLSDLPSVALVASSRSTFHLP